MKFSTWIRPLVLAGILWITAISIKGKEQRDRFDWLLAQVRDQTAVVLCSDMTMSQTGWSNPPAQNWTTVLKGADNKTYILTAMQNKWVGNSVSVRNVTSWDAEKMCSNLPNL